MLFSIELRCGTSRRKTEELILSLSDIVQSSDGWSYRVRIKGATDCDRLLEASSPFKCLVLGLAFLRQSLRLLQSERKGLKFYIGLQGELDELEIDDIFWTHDCVPEGES